MRIIYFLLEICRRLNSTRQFSTLRYRLIKDKIVLGIRDRSLEDKLSQEPHLDLKKAIEICKAAKLAAKYLNGLAAESQEVSFVKKKQIRACHLKIQLVEPKVKILRKVNKLKQAFYKGYIDSKQWKCFCCGSTHETSCPARNAKCNKFKKIGHYAKVSRTQSALSS